MGENVNVVSVSTGELMMSLFWYYRPEHTQGGRDPSMHCEVREWWGLMLTFNLNMSVRNHMRLLCVYGPVVHHPAVSLRWTSSTGRGLKDLINECG